LKARVIALAVAITAALAWAMLATTPPPPVRADAPATAFSADRAFIDLSIISRAPRPVGSYKNARVRDYLARRLRTLDAEVREQTILLPAKSLAVLARWSGLAPKAVMAHNVIGLIAGRDRSRPALLLMAHHDSVWGSPGAADDAMGVATAIETARALLARGRPERDLILLFTDGEEVGLDGAKAFFAHHGLAARVGVIINLEARGAAGRATMFETGPDNGAMMQLYARHVDRPSTSSLAVLAYDLMPNSTDYSVAKALGIPGFNIAVLGAAQTYHSPGSTADIVDRGSLQDMGDQTLALAAALAFSPDLPPRTTNAAFGDLLGRTTITYPAGFGWVILILSAVLIGLSLKRARPTARELGAGASVTLSILMHGILLLTALNAISGSGGANYYDRLAALPRLEVMAALSVTTLVLLTRHCRRTGGALPLVVPAMLLMWAGLLSGGPLILLVLAGGAAMLSVRALPERDERPGEAAILLLFGGALLLQIGLPTAGPLLQWPLLLAALAIAARTLMPAAVGMIVTTIAAAAGLGHIFAQGHSIFLAIGADWPAVWMILLIAALPLLLPLLPECLPRWPAGAALAAALLLALWVRLDPIAPTIPTYSDRESAKTRD